MVCLVTGYARSASATDIRQDQPLGFFGAFLGSRGWSTAPHGTSPGAETIKVNMAGPAAAMKAAFSAASRTAAAARSCGRVLKPQGDAGINNKSWTKCLPPTARVVCQRVCNMSVLVQATMHVQNKDGGDTPFSAIVRFANQRLKNGAMYHQYYTAPYTEGGDYYNMASDAFAVRQMSTSHPGSKNESGDSSTAPLVLVTGSTGYVANHCVKELQKRGCRVRCSVRSTKNEIKVKPLFELYPEAKYPLELVEADLLKPDSWKNAVKGCDFVLHTASPFPQPSTMKDPENQIIRPAVEGTLNVLKACAEEPSIKRVVMTSSIASVYGGIESPDHVLTEKDWTNVDDPNVEVYYKSKSLAEMAAWDFVNRLPADRKFELATINPAYVMGPVLSKGVAGATSIAGMKNFLDRKYPLWPKLEFQMCDVRDVALAHYKAMVTPDAAGNRHIIFTQSMWMTQVAGIVSKNFCSLGYCPSTRTLPKPIAWLAGIFDKQVREYAYPRIGLHMDFDNSRMKNVLGIQPRPIEQTLVDMCHSMIKLGLVKKTRKYAEFEEGEGKTA